MMLRDLETYFLTVAARAAIACFPSVGKGDRHRSDALAVASMRKEMGLIPMLGTIVIGEGERDDAPMLFIGEKVGLGQGDAVDIAVDPLEGTNLCADNLPNAITVLAASEKGGLLHAPDLYMNKLAVGPSCKGHVRLEDGARVTIQKMSACLNLSPESLCITVLDRPRHATLIKEIQSTGAKVRLISDGDLGACILACLPDSGIHGVMGIGGAPEGVLAAAALKGLGGEILGQLLIDNNTVSQSKAESMGVKLDHTYTTEALAPGKDIIFVATGVTSGDLLEGVRQSPEGMETQSLIITTRSQSLELRRTLYKQESN